MGNHHSYPKPVKSKTSSWRTDAPTSTFNPVLSTLVPFSIPSDNIFTPIQADDILPQIPISLYHPVRKLGILDDEDKTLHTNKFYANTFLGGQDQPVWTTPYYLWWGKGRMMEKVAKAGTGGTEDGVGVLTWGMCIGHGEDEDFEFGDGDPPRYFMSPRKQSIVLSARELDARTTLTTSNHLPFSVNITLRKRSSSPDPPKITFPVVQGMSFVTACYRSASPMIQTAGKDGFRDISPPISIGLSTKYRIKDFEGRSWLLYVNPANGTRYDGTALTRIGLHTCILPPNFRGTIQIAKNPIGSKGEALYDQAYGTFVAEARIYATVSDARGTYTFNYTKFGHSPMLSFVLPHHIQSLDPDLKPAITSLQLQTPTKGMSTAVWGDHLTFIERALPISMGFAPWVPPPIGTKESSSSSKQYTPPPLKLTPELIALLTPIAELDLRRVMSEEIPEDSLYYAGKSLARFATIVWVLREVLVNNSLATSGLSTLKTHLALYIENQQKHALHYDNTWKGLVSSAGFAQGVGADFGNTWYNDHHFHYGYFVYTAAVVGYLDPAWLSEGDNKAWVNSLVKDFAESDEWSRDYPFSRAFDWWNGHSWAKGLVESADGKDQESTGEDGFSAFAVKMWGKVSGDGNMEKRGNLMLAIQARSFNTYFHLCTCNPNGASPAQPPRYLPNTLAGILFENKVDYATYFGTAPHLIHGIHMLPISPATALLRPRPFVTEEWTTHFSQER